MRDRSSHCGRPSIPTPEVDHETVLTNCPGWSNRARCFIASGACNRHNDGRGHAAAAIDVVDETDSAGPAPLRPQRRQRRLQEVEEKEEEVEVTHGIAPHTCGLPWVSALFF